jgi:hypothetical protein
MGKLTQFGIAVAILGAVITFIGLFPGVVGLEQTTDVGVIQVLTILVGFSALITGAFIFVQSTYYPGVKHTLAQEIGVRLSMTGLVIATASGLSDILGFGSNPPITDVQRPFVGPYQTFGLIGGFLIASLGVVIFAMFGHIDSSDEGDQ